MSISLARWKNVEKNVFKYCGRDVVKDTDGIHITCPSLIDRVRPIYLTVEERKKKQEKITEAQRQQLRSIIGFLAWLARVCRPDLAYAASKLQSNVHTATYEDIRYANTVTSIAHKTKSAGIHCPLRAFRVEDAVIVGMQDSSFANAQRARSWSFAVRAADCSAWGRPSSRRRNRGNFCSWTIKRVCRSTRQAEAMSLISGMEEAEHVRMMLHGLCHPRLRGGQQWQINAMDGKNIELFKDCRSLEESVNQSGLHTVGDKRLAIDLSGVRQQIWRRQGAETGHPLLTDHLPAEATTKLSWVNTEKMSADSLTESMKPKTLSQVMAGQWIDLTPDKDNQCGNEDSVDP